MQEM
jgi:hypothetical protein